MAHRFKTTLHQRCVYNKEIKSFKKKLNNLHLYNGRSNTTIFKNLTRIRVLAFAFGSTVLGRSVLCKMCMSKLERICAWLKIAKGQSNCKSATAGAGSQLVLFYFCTCAVF